jgi:nucleoid-associated protein YgaU
LALLAGRAAGSQSAPEAGPPAVRVVVAPGDTLWEIARARVGPEADPRPLVDAIREANGLGTGPLPAGSLIALPPTP